MNCSRKSSAGIIDVTHPHNSDILAHASKVIRRSSSIKVRGTMDHRGLTVILKHLLSQNRDRSGLTATVVSWARVASEHADSPTGWQLRIDVADRCKKVRVNWRAPDSIARLICGLPNLRQLGRGYVLASNLTVKGRLLRGVLPKSTTIERTFFAKSG